MSSLQFGILLTVFLVGVVKGGEWRYSGKYGPTEWGQLFPEACAGTAQSPIDIQPERTIYDPNLKDFALYYDPPKPGSKMVVKNNGHAIQVNTEGEFYVSNGGLQNIYKVAQFHFHWGSEDHKGSEHLLDSVAYPIEMHIVTYNHDLYGDLSEAVTEKGGLAVLGVLFEVQETPNKYYEPIIKALEVVRDPGDDREVEMEALSLRDLLPQDITKYYRYNGSLTTPGCFETVTWTVFHQKQKISFGQLLKFRRVLQRRHKKHRKHHKRSTKSRRQRAAEKGAEAVLDEIGIQGDPVQKGELMTKLVMKQEDEIVESSNEMATKESSASEPMSSENSGHTTPDSGSNSKDSTEEHPKGHHKAHSPAVKKEQPMWIQEYLVDNFRPVQPLHDRRVYRSFKLKDIYMQESMYKVRNEARADPPQEKPAVATVYSNQKKHAKPDNAAGSIQISIIALILAVFTTFFL